jgi:hypothetical protein
MTKFPGFPPKMTAYLVRIGNKAWQGIVTKVRWAYSGQTWEVPTPLARYITFLPEDPRIWQAYMAEITRERARVRRSAEYREESKVAARRRKKRAAYQRKYMRQYRERLRSNTV